MLTELSFSKVAEDDEGFLQRLRSVVVGEDIGWYVKVCF